MLGWRNTTNKEKKTPNCSARKSNIFLKCYKESSSFKNKKLARPSRFFHCQWQCHFQFIIQSSALHDIKIFYFLLFGLS
jgi:hypothetical protein